MAEPTVKKYVYALKSYLVNYKNTKETNPDAIYSDFVTIAIPNNCPTLIDMGHRDEFDNPTRINLYDPVPAALTEFYRRHPLVGQDLEVVNITEVATTKDNKIDIIS